jgi:hypothetical protein
MSRNLREGGPTPSFPPPVMDSVPNGTTISDDSSMDSSVCTQHSEPEGEFRDDDDGFVHIPHPLPASNIVNEGAGLNIIPCTQYSELKGEFRDDDEGFVHIPQPLPALYIVIVGWPKYHFRGRYYSYCY